MDIQLTPACTPFLPLDPSGRPPPFDPRWRTKAVLAVAHAIDSGLTFYRMPDLADALAEAGCDSRPLLTHCRYCPTHDPACWAVNLVLGRPTAEILIEVFQNVPELHGLFKPPPNLRVPPAAPPATPRPPASTRTASLPGMPLFRVLALLGVASLVILVIVSMAGAHRPSAPVEIHARPDTTPTTTLTADDRALLDAPPPGKFVNGRLVREGEPGWSTPAPLTTAKP